MADTTVRTHAKFAGRLCIPYITRAGVVSQKFRALHHEDPKYLCLSNDKPRLFGAENFFAKNVSHIAICEGELDALILSANVMPAVGCPGVSTWQRHHPRCFQGYERVFVFADGDGPGHDLAKRISRDLDQAVVVFMPDGMDVNDMFLAEGAEGLRRRAGLSE